MSKLPITINLWDHNFVGQQCSVANQVSEHVRYVRGLYNFDGITVFTDGWMFAPVVDEVRSRYKIGWLHEGRELRPENYERSKDVRWKFDFIMTHDTELLKLDPEKYKFTIRGGSWVPLDQWGAWPKSKNISMILSGKHQLSGQQLRHAVADRIAGIDLYGARGQAIGTNKALAYTDYRFAIVIEACREENFFSEHLIDAIAYGCVPVYWGCPNIYDFMEARGLFIAQDFNDIASFAFFITDRGAELYQGYYLQQNIHANLAICRQYAITEDWQYKHVYKSLLEERR